ncbi:MULTISPECIES: alpha/beta hydrolase [Pseudoalteromonas]|uniref:Esterase n=1 Tax=Pseudoalteromonas amylolytica TaxID=1859457 RepID=A0A1S1MP58_9GAMM|nr:MULTISPECIES: alpha/beta hydrolase-fold protein [Pseudoalteromonas]OHU84350.1 esterase [Pseudoalteromonas sp. JW3]OHU87111.1 esterase [Pseudoalteromonas amylolytica]
MFKIQWLILSVCLTFSATAKDKFTSQPFELAKTLTFKSQSLQQSRSVHVYLPPSYTQNKQQTYPVIYLLDGSKDEDFIHIAGLVQFANFPWLNILPDTIVVGIENIDRKHDFTTPSNNALDKKELPSHGGAKQFIDFIAKELQPMITQHYRTNGTSTLIGQSLGGLLASEILFNHSAMFDHYVIISPSLWWNDEALLKQAFNPSQSPKSVYIGVGKEGEQMERLAKQLHKKITPKLLDNTQLEFGYFPQLTHGDTLHLAVYDAFKKIKY